MKTNLTKSFFAFILLMFAFTGLNAQNCPANKVWACRYDACGLLECKCVPANNVENWLATVPPCKDNKWWHPNCCDGWRSSENEMGISLEAYPNPASGSTTISFYLEGAQQVSLKLFDINGRLVATLADETFDGGVNDLVWNSMNVSAGIYLLQFQSEENSEMLKLAIAK